LKKLLLLGGKSLQAVGRVLLKLTDLIIKTLLIVLILLLVLALNDLLSLFGDSVELHVECTLLVVLNLQVQALYLIFDLLQLRVVLQDRLHLSNFLVSLLHNVVVLGIYNHNVD